MVSIQEKDQSKTVWKELDINTFHPPLLCSFSWILTRFYTIVIIGDLGDSMVSIHEKEQSKTGWKGLDIEKWCVLRFSKYVAGKNWFFVMKWQAKV